MCRQFYTLNRAPFQAVIDPDFFWRGKNSEKFLKVLSFDLEQHFRLTLVTGGPGYGKSTFLCMALDALDPSVLVAVIPDSRLIIQEFYDLTAHAFHLPGQMNSREKFHDHLRTLLRKAEEQRNMSCSSLMKPSSFLLD